MKRNQGFSLIEVIVVMGILSIAAYAFMHLSQMKAKERRTQRANEELKTYFDNIEGLLKRGPYCVASLQEIKIDVDLLKPEYPFSAIKTPADFSKYELGETLESLIVLDKLLLAELIPANEERSHYLASIQVGFRKKGQVYGGKSIKKSVDLEIILNEEGKVTGCWPLSERPDTAQNFKDIHGLEEILKQQKKNLPSEEEVKKIIENNPLIKQLYEQSQQIEEANKRMKEMIDR